MVEFDAVASLGGRVTDQFGNPIANAKVTLIDSITRVSSLTAYTNATGEYSFDSIIAGFYDVVVRRSSYLTSVDTEIAVTGNVTLNSSLSASTSRIEGTLRDTSGRAIPAGVVLVLDAENRILGQAISLTDGTFVITTVQGTGLRLEAQTDGYSTVLISNFSASSDETIQVGDINLVAVAVGQATNDSPFGGSSTLLTSSATATSLSISLTGRATSTDFEFGLRSNGGPPTTDDDGFSQLDAINPDAAGQPLQLDTDLSLIKLLEDRLRNYKEVLELPRVTDAGPPPNCPECLDEYEALKKAIEEQERIRDAYSGIYEQLINLRFLLGLAFPLEANSQIIVPFVIPFVPVAGQFAFLPEIAGALNGLVNGYQDMVNVAEGEQFIGKASSFGALVAGSFQNAGQALRWFAQGLMGSNGPINDIEEAYLAGNAKYILRFGLLANALSFFGQGINGNLFKLSIDATEKIIITRRILKALEPKLRDAIAKTLDARDEYNRCLLIPCDDNNGGGYFQHFGRGSNGSRIDPNDILGPAGYGDPRFVPASTSLSYTVRFENLDTATLPVQTLTITTQLDSDLDYRTVRFGSFGFRGLTFELPVSQPFISQRVDLTDTLGFFVDVIATVDVTTGLATWTLSAIDPATGEEPRDERIGFLPPNTNDGLGEGFVTYSVRAKSGALTGDTIDAKATIIFDTELPLDTPTWTNTLDSVAPTSQVIALPEVSPLPTFILSWTAGDAPGGSGLANTSIYVREDAGDYRLLVVADASVRQFFFEGKAGKSYSFLSVAEDNAGNREKAPALADAVTTIFAPPPTLSIISKSETIVGQPLSFGFAVTNFDAIPNLGYLIKVDWDNDGNFDNTVVGPEGTTISHAFDSAGSKNVRAALFSSEDVIVAETNTVIEVALAGVVTDPENESAADLVWGGTEGNDRYRFEELNSTTIRVITLNADDEVIDSVDFTGVTGSVRVYTLAGNDFVDASALITKSLYADLGDGDDTVLGGKADDFIDADGAEGHGNDEIISGDGNDTISADGSEGYDPDDSTGQDTILAGSGNDVIDADGAEGSNDDVIEGGSGDDVIHADGAEGIAEQGTYGKDTVSGGEGDDLIVGDGAEGAADQITGDDGNDVIIGGAGADQLDGGIGSDLVVAGTVTDLDAASLILVHAEWKSTRSLAQRVDNLLGTGTGDRANDDVFLTPANTKLVDQAIDSVLGGADEDWLLADAGEDEITDYEPLEDILSF